MWHPVAFADDLDDQPMAVRLLDEAIAIARIDGDAVAFKDLCIHRGTALSLGTVVDGGIAVRVSRLDIRFDRSVRADSLTTGGEYPAKGQGAVVRGAGVRWAGVGVPGAAR